MLHIRYQSGFNSHDLDVAFVLESLAALGGKICYMEVVNNKKQFRFEIALEDGEFATLEYRWLKGAMVLMHTIVPVSHRKKGIGSIIVKYVLDCARAQNLKILPYCQFVLLYLKEHPEYAVVVDVGGNK